MAHKKPTSKKSPSAKNSTTKRSAVSRVAKSAPVSTAAPAKNISPSVYEEMAQRTLGLWREQLSAVSRSPAAMQQMGKMMQPVFSLFTQGMDMWLMMADPFNQGAAAYTGSQAASNDAQKKQTASSAKAPAQNAAPSMGKKRSKTAKSTQRTAPVAAVDVPGASAMAELARRIASMERQRASSPSANPRAAAPKTAAVIGFEEAVGQRRRSGSRA